ncbi:armadillo-type protein [Tribonema minus]|uniref:Armadillo-type protein n=1 Tax=Tribonema minus TaxID=303371 RepID=A0A836CJA7_9STRA|nr:armadillo-type protein [Tribonema minus]
MAEDTGNGNGGSGDVFAALRAEPGDAPLAVIVDALTEFVQQQAAAAGVKLTQRANGLAHMEQGRQRAVPSATEYFAAIMAALDGTDQTRTPQLLALLTIALPHANARVVRAKFSQTRTPQLLALLTIALPHASARVIRAPSFLSRLLPPFLLPQLVVATLLRIAAACEEAEDASAEEEAALHAALKCVGMALAALDPPAWAAPAPAQALTALLERCGAAQSGTRRAAQTAVAQSGTRRAAQTAVAQALTALLARCGAPQSGTRRAAQAAVAQSGTRRAAQTAVAQVLEAGRGTEGGKAGGKKSRGAHRVVTDFCLAVLSGVTSQDARRTQHLLTPPLPPPLPLLLPPPLLPLPSPPPLTLLMLLLPSVQDARRTQHLLTPPLPPPLPLLLSPPLLPPPLLPPLMLLMLLLPPTPVQDARRTQHLLTLLRRAAPLLPAAECAALCQALLRLPALGNPQLTAAVMQLTAAVMQCLSSIVQSPHATCLPPAALPPLVLALLDVQPGGTDAAGATAFAQPGGTDAAGATAFAQPGGTNAAGATAFAQALASALVRMRGSGGDSAGAAAARSLLPRAAAALVSYCESPAAALHGAACSCLNLLFQTVVDQEMVSEMAESLGKPRKGKPTALETVLCSLEGLLQYKYQKAWPKALPLLGRLFLHLRSASYPILSSTLKGLGDLHDALASIPAAAAAPGVLPALNEALGLAIEGVGMERVLGVLPLRPAGTPDTMGVAESRAWLVSEVRLAEAQGVAVVYANREEKRIPLLREHGGAAPARLAYFHHSLVELAKHCDQVSRSGKLTANEGKTQSLRVEQVWGLFPAFCAAPTDVASAFGPLAPVLANAMQDVRYPGILAEDVRYPGILTEVCNGLQALIAGAESRGTAQQEELRALSATSTKFLPALFAQLDKKDAPLSDDKVLAVCGAAAAFARVSPKPFLSQLFKRLLQKLLEATAAAQASRDKGGDAPSDDMDVADAQSAAQEGTRVALNYMAMAAALVPSLEEECSALLYRACKPLVLDDVSAQLQKRAYRMLLALCASQGKLLASAERLPDVLELFVTSLSCCHVTARQSRLRCLTLLAQSRLRCLTLLAQSFDATNPAHAAAVPALLGEVVLSTKDSNGRTRESAYELLALAHYKCSDPCNMYELLLALAHYACADPSEMVVATLGCLGAHTPHMRSAGVLALSRLQYEFGHFRSENWQYEFGHFWSENWQESVAQMTPQLITTMLLLAREPSREVVKAVLGFLRVAVGGADRAVLEPLLLEITAGVMTGVPRATRLYLRARTKVVLAKLCRKFGFERVKVVLAKLCRKFGFERVKELVPEEDRKLIVGMQKAAEKELKAKAARHAKREDARAAAKSQRSSGGGGGANTRFDAMMHGDSDASAHSDSDDEPRHSAQQQQRSAKEKGGKARGGRGGEFMVREKGDEGDGGVVDLLYGAMGDEGEDGVVDLLDGAMVRNLKLVDGEASDDSDMEGEEIEVGVGEDGRLVIPASDDSDMEGEEIEFGVGEDGRLVIPDDGGDSSDDDDASDGDLEYAPSKRKRGRNEAADSDDSGGEYAADNDTRRTARRLAKDGTAAAAARKAKATSGGSSGGGTVVKATSGGGSGGGAVVKAGALPRGTGGWGKGKQGGARPGAEFKSKKAGGDVRRKGQKLEPYAYIPLDPKALLTSKKKSHAKSALNTQFTALLASKKKSHAKSAVVQEYGAVVHREKRGYQSRTGNNKK